MAQQVQQLTPAEKQALRRDPNKPPECPSQEEIDAFVKHPYGSLSIPLMDTATCLLIERKDTRFALEVANCDDTLRCFTGELAKEYERLDDLHANVIDIMTGYADLYEHDRNCTLRGIVDDETLAKMARKGQLEGVKHQMAYIDKHSEEIMSKVGVPSSHRGEVVKILKKAVVEAGLRHSVWYFYAHPEVETVRTLFAEKRDTKGKGKEKENVKDE